MQDVFGLARATGFTLRRGQRLVELADALISGIQRGRGLFEKVVDGVTVVAAERGLFDLDVSELSGGDLHDASL